MPPFGDKIMGAVRQMHLQSARMVKSAAEVTSVKVAPSAMTAIALKSHDATPSIAQR
jgi:hypothetical protein